MNGEFGLGDCLQEKHHFKDTVELKDLTGRHMLDAVNHDLDSHSPGAIFMFRLDGVVFMAAEDPDDGYRSCLGEIKASMKKKMTNIFQPIEVVGYYEDQGGRCDILKLIDVANGKVVLEVGTENADDYYPYFVDNFYPDNMSLNDQRTA